MRHTMWPRLKRSGDAEGMATVEFAIILTVFLMLALGILEFGFDWYLKTALTNAARDGARFGTRYTAGTTVPSDNDIRAAVNASLTSVFPADTTWTTTPTWTGPTSPPVSNVTTLTVTVSTVKTWSALGNLVSGLNLNNVTISAATTMVSE